MGLVLLLDVDLICRFNLGNCGSVLSCNYVHQTKRLNRPRALWLNDTI